MIGAIPVSCYNEGCSYKTTLSDLKKHMDKCDKRTYDCMMCN